MPRRLGAFADGLGDDADLIDARSERHEAVAADAAVGRLQSDDAAERGRLAHRTAGFRAERRGNHARGDGGRGAARRAAGRRATDPTDCAPDRTPSARSTSPSRTRRGSFCRRCGSRTHAGARRRWHRTARRSSPRISRRAGRRHVGRDDVVLHRDRHSVSRHRERREETRSTSD